VEGNKKKASHLPENRGGSSLRKHPEGLRPAAKSRLVGRRTKFCSSGEERGNRNPGQWSGEERKRPRKWRAKAAALSKVRNHGGAMSVNTAGVTLGHNKGNPHRVQAFNRTRLTQTTTPKGPGHANQHPPQTERLRRLSQVSSLGLQLRSIRKGPGQTTFVLRSVRADREKERRSL